MATWTQNKNFIQPDYNSFINDWNLPVNSDWGFIDIALGTATALNATGLSGTQPLNTSMYVPLAMIVSGTPSGAINYQFPASVGGWWPVRNNTNTPVTFSTAAGGPTVTIPAGTNIPITTDGTSLGVVQILTATGAAAGSSGQVQFNLTGNLAGSPNLIFDEPSNTLTVEAQSNLFGPVFLGGHIGDTTTISGNTLEIPNTLAIGYAQPTLYLNGQTGQVGVGTNTVGTGALTVGGGVQSTSGGYTFPDGSVQTTAAPVVISQRTWTPTTNSPNGLSFASGVWNEITYGGTGIAFVWGTVTYNPTSDGSNALIGSFPVTFPNRTDSQAPSAAYIVGNSGAPGVPVIVKGVGAQAEVGLYNGLANSGNALPNSAFSGATVTFSMTYPST